MAFNGQIVPASGGGAGGGGGGGGSESNELVFVDFSGAISQNAQTVGTFATETVKSRIAQVVITALDQLDYMVSFYDAVGGTPTSFLGSVYLPAACATRIAGASEYQYSVECSIPYQNNGGTPEIFASLSPRSGNKNATDCFVTLFYYPEGD
jgi:hypothetical protein